MRNIIRGQGLRTMEQEPQAQTVPRLQKLGNSEHFANRKSSTIAGGVMNSRKKMGQEACFSVQFAVCSLQKEELNQ